MFDYDFTCGLNISPWHPGRDIYEDRRRRPRPTYSPIRHDPDRAERERERHRDFSQTNRVALFNLGSGIVGIRGWKR